MRLSSKRKMEDYLLYLIIGGLYAFAINLSILTTTIVQVPVWSLFMVGLVFLLLFALAFWNRYTMLAALGFVLFVGLILFWMRDSMEGFWYFIHEIIMLARGYLAFRPEFTWPVVLAVCLLTALFIAVCLYVHFHFYMLAGFGAAIYIICWLMDYPQSLLGFIIYLFCFCVLLVRKLQDQKRPPGASAGDGTRAALITAPLCAAVVWFAISVPLPAAALDNAAINRFFNEPWEVVGEIFFLAFNPKYFSFQTTGFAGQGGRLGGPVSPNHRPVMAVEAPRRIYLSGATHNIYTGYGWTSDSSGFVTPYGHVHPSYIEFLETAHALFRHTARMEVTGQWNNQMRLTSYLPLSSAEIFVGNNRTGSLFRPMRERGIRFENPSLNHMLLVNTSGDRRLEELIPRHSVYRYNFLDIDYRQDHIQEILRYSRRGLYRERLESSLPLHIDIWGGDEIAGRASIGELAFENQADIFGQQHMGGIAVQLTGSSEDAWAITAVRYPPEDIYQVAITIGPRAPIANHLIHRDELSLEIGDLEGFDQMLDSLYQNDSEIELFDSFSFSSAVSMIDMLTGIGQDALLADYADFVYAHYTALPYTLPQRVIDLAYDITRGYDTDYDRVRALQEYLIQFPYTLMPGVVPRDRDFVDYFLFDGQEGYCVYYASAMVIMTRAIGIPARYAEGFLLPAFRDQETGMFTVTNRNAHAWAEVYFEGFGWLIVETTAPYLYAMYERPFLAATDIFAWGFSDWAYEEYLRQMGLWYMMQGIEGWEPGDVSAGFGMALPAVDVQVTQADIWAMGMAVGGAVFGLIIFYLSVWHGLHWLRLRKVKHMNTNDRAIYYYREILRITEFWRYPILNEETTHEYGQRLRYRFTFVNETVFLRDLNEIYYRARYGGEALSETEAAFMRDCYYELVEYIKAVRGTRRLAYIRYIKGVVAL